MFLVCRYDGRVPASTAESGQEAVAALGQRVAPIVEAYISAMEARRLKDGIRLAMDASREGNAFFQVQFCLRCLLMRLWWSCAKRFEFGDMSLLLQMCCVALSLLLSVTGIERGLSLRCSTRSCGTW